MGLGTTPNTGLSFSRITTCVNDTTHTTTLQAPDYDIVSYDELCVCCVFNLRVAFQSMKAPVYRLPGSPPPPPFFLFAILSYDLIR